jgi:hypothetical protein
MNKFEDYKKHAQSITEYTKQSFGEEITSISYVVISEQLIPGLLKAAIMTGKAGPDPEYILFAFARRLHEGKKSDDTTEDLILKAMGMLMETEPFLAMMNEAQELSDEIGFGDLG